MPTMPDYTVYKATYSGTPVYEFIAKGIACMRRRSDSWINATQILKVADFDKPQRTRILEREVQRGVHEKVQGGYGKYQGTWVPLDRARAIAAQYNVEELLMPIFSFRPSTESPPLAPKHITAASTKPRPARAPARQPLVKRVPKPPPPPPPPVIQAPPSEDSFEEDADVLSDMEPLDDPSASIMSSSPTGGGLSDMDDHPSQHSAGMALKRKRAQMEHDHNSMVHYDSMSSPHHRRLSYSDELLDYFMTKDMDVPDFLLNPPPDFGVDEEIDTEGHTAIHWAAAMGDLRVIELLCKARANPSATNHRGETPLMRAVLFTNNYDRRSFPRLVETLRNSIFSVDKFGSTVFHHIAATTSSRNKLLAARYYDEVLLQKLSEGHTMDEIAHFLDAKDMHGDTALTISARNFAKKCVRTLLGYNASPDIPNNAGETADRLIIAAEEQRKHFDNLRASSSSPFQPHHQHHQQQQSIPPYLHAPATQSAINYAHASYVPQPHTSEAAITATKKAIPLMAEMLEGLATAFDKELHDKEEDHSQAQHLLHSSTLDISACKQTSNELLVPFETPENLDAQIHQLKAESDSLATSLKRELERAQIGELAACVAAEEGALPSTATVTEEPQSDREIMEKLHAARQLAAAQNERADLIETIVRAYARSGAGGKMADYRRLIALSCSLLPDDVEKLLPEILKDLEAGGDGSQGLAEALLV